MSAELGNCLEITMDSAVGQWRAILARSVLPKGQRQGPFLPIENVLWFVLAAVPDFVGVAATSSLLGQEELGVAEIEIAVDTVRKAVETARLRQWFGEQERERSDRPIRLANPTGQSEKQHRHCGVSLP